jgi:hypothetical protein
MFEAKVVAKVPAMAIKTSRRVGLRSLLRLNFEGSWNLKAVMRQFFSYTYLLTIGRLGSPNPDMAINSRCMNNLPMSILNFDGPSGRNFGKPFRVVLGIGALAAVVAVASTLAANININSGPVEFGQGVAQTTACDDSITVTPRTQFINTSSSVTSTIRSFPVGASGPDAIIVLPTDGEFFYPGMQFYITIDGESSRTDLVVTEVSELLDLVPMDETSTPTNISAPYEFLEGFSQAYEITLNRSLFGFWTLAEATVGASGFQFSGVDVSDIDATEGNCLGKTFTLKAYGDTETAALATYTVFVGENGFLSGDGNIESSNPGTSSSSFSLEFNSTRISATSVYKITIESSDYGPSFLDGRTLDASHIGIGVETLFEETPTVIVPICEDGTCTSIYQRPDSFDMGVSNIEITLTRNLSGDADTSWILNIVDGVPGSYALYGYIKYFNGTHGVIFITEDEVGPIPPEAQQPVTFSTAGPLPVNVSGEPEGTLTWSYPSESRYTE